MKQFLNRYIFKSLKGVILTTLFFSLTTAKAQPVTVTAKLDSTLLFIGGQMNLTLEVTQPKNTLVALPQFRDTITAAIEVVKATKTDTIPNHELITIQQVYTITSFDSGLHYIPPIELQYFDGEIQRSAKTRALALNVINPFVDVDPQKGIFDIKAPFNLPFSALELLRFLFWYQLFVLIQALIGIGWVIWHHRKKPIKTIFIKEKPKEPPHVIALRKLEQMKSEKIWQKGAVKQFHSQVTDILRKYMEERYQFNAMEQTTHEIISELKKIELPDQKLLEKIEKTLSTADLAKFAKYEPLPDENDFSLITAFFFVNQTKEEPLVELEELKEDNATTEQQVDNIEENS